MERLADFEYYEKEYGGTLLERAGFYRLALRASAIVDAYTFGRASKCGLDVVKDTVCAVADVIYKNENRNIKTETNDGYSVTYNDISPERINDEIYSTVAAYLEHTDLMRRT